MDFYKVINYKCKTFKCEPSELSLQPFNGLITNTLNQPIHNKNYIKINHKYCVIM